MKISTIVLFVVLLLVMRDAYAQFAKSSNELVPDLKSYARKTYNTNDGLPSNRTTCILKDRRGFLWVGTENCLCRFDGYSFKIFVHSAGDTTSLTNNFIKTIIEDKKGRIWVGTLDGLNLLDPVTEKFERFNHDEKVSGSISNNKIWSLLADRDDQIWIGTDDGFNHFIERARKFEVFQPNISDLTAMKGKSVNAIIEDGNNDLWLGNWGGGLNRFNKKTKKFVNFPQAQNPDDKNPNDVWCLSLDERGNIWVGTYWKGLFKFDVASKKFTAYPSPQNTSHSVFQILNIDQQLKLLAADDGFFWFNSSKNIWKKINDLTSHQHAGLFQDNNDIIWVCSMDGLTKFDGKQYKFHFFPFLNEKKAVKSLVVKDNRVWLGSRNGLSSISLPGNDYNVFTRVNEVNKFGNSIINKLYVDSRNKLWALSELGFDEYDSSTVKSFHHSHHSSLGSLFNEDAFRDVLEVSPGNYWLATDAGLKIYNSKSNTYTHYFNQKGKPYTLSNNHLFCLQKDVNSDIWIGTIGGGINRFVQSSGRFYNYVTNDKKSGSISNNDIHYIFLDSHKNIWICTQDGLNKYSRNSDSFIGYSKKDGFASNVFKHMVEDVAGNFWILTESGISCFDPSTLKVTNFDEGDGVFANSTIYKVNDHQILLGGNKGLVSFDPIAINYNRLPPPIYFSDFQIFNKSIIPGADQPLKQPIQNTKKIVLNYSQSFFSIEFVALNFTHTEKNRYAYKLEGFDPNWNYVGEQRKATYTNLNPGTYVFHVKASNNDDVWNERGISLLIIITPPWYQTWWAYLIYTGLLGAGIYGYIFYSNRQAKLKYEVKLAHIEAEKEKELHEKKLSFFTNISHELRTPLTMIISPLKEILYNGGNDVNQQNLNTINRNAKRLLSLVDQLLLFRKADTEGDVLKLSKINISELSNEVFLCFSHQANAKKLCFGIHCSSDDISLVADAEKLEIILFNLIANAIKFTEPGGEVEVQVTEVDDHIHISVRDTGCGITAGAGDKLYHKYYQEYDGHYRSRGGLGIGLFLVKNYTEHHGGKVEYESEIGKGTIFHISLPKGAQDIKSMDVTEDIPSMSVFLKELMDQEFPSGYLNEVEPATFVTSKATSDRKSILIIEDSEEISNYITQIFISDYCVYEATSGEDGLKMIVDIMPDLIISDVMMSGISGIELCEQVKADPNLNHIPVILLTAISASEIKLKGIEGGADDYITKPFEKDLLIARVAGLLKVRNDLQRYFFNEITLKPNNLKISQEYKDFLQKCMEIVEKYLSDPDFCIKILANEIGMSHSNIYRRIKSISGQTANSFIRLIRLRKAAELFLTTDSTVAEAAFKVGFNDAGYFREQFFKLFGLNPSEYIKKFRRGFHNAQAVNRDIVKKGHK